MSLRLQTLGILVLGLVLSHAVGLAIYAADRKNAVATTEATDVAERASSVVLLLRNVPEAWRAELLAASDSRSFRVWRTEAPALATREQNADEEALLSALRTLLPRLADREMRVFVGERPPSGAEPPPREESPGALAPNAFDAAAEVVAISIQHPDGYWLNFLGAVPRPVSPWPGVLTGAIITVVSAVGAIAFWLVNHVTRPLEKFTEAARRLGMNLRAPPLPIEGPKEVALAAGAFNDMQQRIARLVENRMELLAAISHDLRTPITRLKLRCDLLDNFEDKERFLDTLQEMEDITATFLDYARSSAGAEDRRRIELTSLVESVCVDFADAGSDVAWVEAPAVFVDCKRSAVRRAVGNLVDNAIKYAGNARVTVQRMDGCVEISVEDDGPGIAPEEMDRALTPFHRGEPSRSKTTGGVGLGLSIAQAVAHDHGGDLVLSRSSSGGLRAALTVPD